MDEEDLELRNTICSRCGGMGRIGQEKEAVHYASNRRSEYDLVFEFTCICPKCKGAGKVDWISNIVGSKGHLIMTGIPTLRRGILRNE